MNHDLTTPCNPMASMATVLLKKPSPVAARGCFTKLINKLLGFSVLTVYKCNVSLATCTYRKQIFLVSPLSANSITSLAQ